MSLYSKRRIMKKILIAVALMASTYSPAAAQDPCATLKTAGEVVACVGRNAPANPSPAELRDLLTRTASALNAVGVDSGGRGPFGILRKESGHNCAGFSCDVICAANTKQTQAHWDIWIGGDPHAPVWPRPKTGDDIRFDTCIFNADPGPGPDPNPEPQPEPGPDPNVVARLAALEAWQAQTLTYLGEVDLWLKEMQQVADSHKRLLDNKEERLAATEAAMARLGCQVIIFGCRVTGK
jgi:hypothetical protein